MEFRFYLNGNKVDAINIAERSKKGIVASPENFDSLKRLLINFGSFQGQRITSAKKLAEMMAHKAALMREVFYKTVCDEDAENNTLKDQLDAFKSVLVHDMTAEQFSDVYAQTIAYGLFTARLHDQTPKDFTRGEALTLIPKSNPFLRQLFHYVAGPDLDYRVVWIVDALCEVFRLADLTEILKDFGTTTGKVDPILHFYETFLAEYDQKLRKSRGVFYTPEPVVNYIVRAIDCVLKSHFRLKDGLTDTSMVQLEVDGHAKGKAIKVKHNIHKVQFLDVAAGTGTFLAEVVKQVYTNFTKQQGMWSSYVDENLLPRLHGFELLMAPYAMCHMKLELLLNETGYRTTNSANPPRLSVYLTNSLEEYHPDSGTLFAQWLSREANAASHIKKNIPIMVAFGNPPYSGHSSNNGAWISGLVDSYKKEPGGNQRLVERNAKWLNDDYVKFIRLGEYFVAKYSEGILSYITNNSYLDSPTFRGMRWHLLQTFDEIYIIDLHGSAKRNEVSPDGTPDVNVFDIQQGVAILIAIKTSNSNDGAAKVFHKDLWGSRQRKYDYLQNTNFIPSEFKAISPSEPFYIFLPRDEKLLAQYQRMPSISDFMNINVLGFQTHRDDFAVAFTQEDIKQRVQDLCNQSLTDADIRTKYRLRDNRDWNLSDSRRALQAELRPDKSNITCSYRPFDDRYCYFDHNVMDYPRRELLNNVAWRENL